MTLSTPMLWVLLPLLVALVSGVLYKRRILSSVITCVVTFGLSLLAFSFPEEMVFSLGPIVLTFEESLGILGRQIVLSYEILPFIALLYGAAGLWLLGSLMPDVPQFFRPSVFVVTASVTAALGVKPFLYAALLIETAVLVSIPMLSPLKTRNQAGILRFLSFQTLAMPFILLAGWLLTGVETLPANSPLIGQTIIALGLGFALWLGVFPFHSWLPMVSQRSHPMVFSFLVFTIPMTVLVFGLNFFDRYTFLRTSQAVFETLKMIGTLMIVLGGVFTAIQNNLKRAFGFSILTETGFSLLAIGLFAQGGIPWLFMLFPTRALGFWLWGFTLSLIEKRMGNLQINSLQGFARQYPIISSGLLVAQLSVAGLPLLAAFPVKVAMLSTVLDAGTGPGTMVFMGNLGLFLFTIRLLSILVNPVEGTGTGRWRMEEKVGDYLPVLTIIVLLILMGVFPHIFLTGIAETLTAFSQLQ